MYPTAKTSRSVAPAHSATSDAFGVVLDVVCKEFAPGIAPLSPHQLRAAAVLADEAWHRYCEAGGDATSTVTWVRERLKREQAHPARRPPMDARTAVTAFRALFDLHGGDLPEF